MSFVRPVAAFLQDYGHRHCHPLNAVLHLIGVPMVLYALYRVIMGDFLYGLLLVALGYFLQFLGHHVQGNEAGEIILIKRVATRFLYGRR
jgi:hypothetical protein